MKVKHRTVCQKCRKRKIGCDGKKPSCTQCVLSGLKCDGYQADWTFVSHNPPAPLKQREKRGQALDNKPSIKAVSIIGNQHYKFYATPMLFQPVLYQPGADQLLDLIVQNYVPDSERASMTFGLDYKEPRICGAWVEVLSNLPCLKTSNSVLLRAVNALAASMLSRSRMANTDCSNSYYTAIHMLRKAIVANGTSIAFDLIPTVMCLTLVELMMPDSADAMTAHIHAVGQCFQFYGPEACKDGVLHNLFVGFRPILMIQALQSRRQTFLGSPTWMDTPFSTFDPSLMQSLFSEVAMLPSLLYNNDLLIQNMHSGDISAITNMVDIFLNLSARLDAWETMLGVQNYWLGSDISRPTEGIDSPIWYSNITMANVYTHLWAFQIVCRCEVEKLVAFISHVDLLQTMPREASDGLEFLDVNRELIVSFARKIYQSMDYLLQDEMGLFGPASTFFSLRMAYQGLNMVGSGQSQGIDCIKAIVDSLTTKGLLSARTFVFGI